jgi:AraC-like DNA-binding protein
MTSPNPIAFTIILIFGLQSILLSSLLLLKKPLSQSNIFLALLLFFFALMSVNISLVNICITYNLIYVFRYFQLELLFGIGPSLYLFTKSITDPDYRISRKEYIHFIPVILEFIFYRTPIYRIGSDGLYKSTMHPYTLVYLIEQWSAAVSIFVYIILSVRLLIKYRRWVENKYSNLKSKTLGWLRIPVIIYSGFWIGWMILTQIDKNIFQNAYKEFYFLPAFIGLSIITCWIGFKGYIKSQTEVSGFSKTPVKSETVLSNPEEVQKIVSLMTNIKPYLNPDLDLLKLSELANLNPKTTSYIINHDLHMNFYEFVNKHRVEEFKQRVHQPDRDKFTLLGHAFESGFNSKSTFNYVFKKFTGQTPKEYYLQYNK